MGDRVLQVMSSRAFAAVTLMFSLFLFVAPQLRNDMLPDALIGFPFIVLWTGAIVAVFALPILLCCEAAVVVSQLRRSATASRLHIFALIVGCVAEGVFLLSQVWP